MPEYELIKVVLTTVVQIREDGKVVNEMLSNPVSCFSAESMVEAWDNAQADVAKLNTQEVLTTPE